MRRPVGSEGPPAWQVAGFAAAIALYLYGPETLARLHGQKALRDYRIEQNQRRWVDAPAVVRRFPPGAAFDQKGFEASTRQWIGIGTPVSQTPGKLKGAGFRTWNPVPAEPEYRYWIWPYARSVDCEDGGYVVKIFAPGRWVVDVTGYYKQPYVCTAP